MTDSVGLQVQVSSFHYRHHAQRVILKDVDITFTPKKIIGLVAPNGTGKSTLIDLISGRLHSDTVRVHYQNLTPQTHPIQWKQSINKMLNPLDLIEDLTGKAHLDVYTHTFHRTRHDLSQLIHTFQLEGFMNQRVRTYSLGMRQRLCFAMAVLSDADILLLDEVMNGLDPTSVKLVTAYLKQLAAQGKTIILASHLLDNLDYCADEIYFLKEQHAISVVCDRTQTSLEVLQVYGEDTLLALLAQMAPSSQLEGGLAIALTGLSDVVLEQLLTTIVRQTSAIHRLYLGSRTLAYLYDELYGEG